MILSVIGKENLFFIRKLEVKNIEGDVEICRNYFKESSDFVLN